MARNPGWRVYRDRWNWHARDIKRQAARIERERRAAEAASICPDADCPDPKCIAARAAAMAGATWQETFAILYPTA